MIRNEKNGLQWHTFELLADCPIIHATFTKHGGCSAGPFSSLNLGINSLSLGKEDGDILENVEENCHRAAQALYLSHLIYAHSQCHGTNIIAINSAGNESLECDGLTTQTKNMGLMMVHADCQAAIFYDPIHHAVANVHCGWRGNVQNIYQYMVRRMHHEYQTRPEDLLVCISPSLGPESAEFIHYKKELPEPFWFFQTDPNYFNFWEISKWQLTQAGVLFHHIQIAEIDTLSNPQDYFSYRRIKNSGRQATICALL